MRLSHKVAIVTAAAGAGIGQGIARGFAQEGANVVVSDAHSKRPFAVAADIAAVHKMKSLGFQCDVSNRQQVEDMVKKTLEEFGRIDILVNNAGIARPAPVVDMSDEAWDLVIDVNLKGTFYCCRAALPTMIKQKSGRIINISSFVGWTGSPDEGANYCAAKAGIMAFTKTLAKEVAPYDITVNTIATALIWNEYMVKAGLSEEHLEQMRRDTPLKRPGKPADVAAAAVFLASEEAGFITGETLCVSGGLYMH